jgi:fumarylacetoacetase
MNDTHNPYLRSWVQSANRPETDFPIQNLPFGVFSLRESKEHRVGVAIGSFILDITKCQPGLFNDKAAEAAHACTSPTLNKLMSLGLPYWSALRQRLSELLNHSGPLSKEQRLHVEQCLVPMRDVEMRLPAQIGDYTDFYASIHHATNVGRMMRPDNPLLPNYKHIPIAYHGRSSSIVPSGTAIRRPLGQLKEDQSPDPAFGPSRMVDYELEVGIFIGPGNTLGEPIPAAHAEEHIFGLCLLNDWSARDMQKWEYQPLGPFLAKNFATTISPWVVTMEALEPFRTVPFKRAQEDPRPLPYLFSEDDQAQGGIDVRLEVLLSSGRMQRANLEPKRLSQVSFSSMYWTVAQMVTHHASNGCNLRPGDLLGSGTVSGEGKSSRGCLLELTWRGKEPITLPTGETRSFLEDGDEVTLRGYCEKPGFARIGFGECKGLILPPVRM